jgi:alpha-L-rhamnosidase
MTHIGRREFLVAGSATAALAALPLHSALPQARPVRVAGLKVDYLDRPLGLENPHPALSWRLESDRRGVRQSAYRVLVASKETLLTQGEADLWDSGQVSSRKTFGIAYHGHALKSRQRCWWRVQVWDEAGRLSEISSTSWWEMGFLSPSDWTAQWLDADDALARADRAAQTSWIWGSTFADAAPRRFRCLFQLAKPSESGLLYIFGESGSEFVSGVWLDGIPVGLQIPVQNLASERISLANLSQGQHCLAIEVKLEDPSVEKLPEAFLQQPNPGAAVFARLKLQDGSAIRLTSGGEWKTSLAEDPRWQECRYDDAGWERVRASPVKRNPVPTTPIQLRREFMVAERMKSARLYITALGAYEARLNGKRIDDSLLSPAASEWGKRLLYRVYDITALLRTGRNVLGLTVADGWYQWSEDAVLPRRIIAQMELVYADGSRQSVGTEPGWLVSRGPILQSRIMWGEIYDARLEEKGWDEENFDASDWQEAVVSTRPPARLVSQCEPPIRVTQILKPLTIAEAVPGSYVIDFGQNFVGFCRLRVKAPSGTRIDMQFAEDIKVSGEIDQFVLLGAKACDTYIARGDPDGETYEPHFTCHDFRYVQLTGLPNPLSGDSIEGMVINSDFGLTGQLRIGNALIEKIWQNTIWSLRSGFQGVFSQLFREESLGWMGDSGMFWDAATFYMDLAAFTRRQMDNVRDDQHPNGSFPDWAPGGLDVRTHGAAPVWSDASVILPWMNWRRYGDLAIIEQNWAAMSRYLDFIREKNPDYIWRKGWAMEYGDWGAVGESHFYHPDKPPTTPMDLIATAYWAHSADLLAQMAEASGRKEDRIRLRALHEQVRRAFVSEFVRPNGEVGNGSQTSYILALKFGLLPDHLRGTAADHLVADIRSRGTALSTGIVGTQYVFDVLADAGYPDLAYSLLLRTQDPSWGFMIDNGATTIWERWDGDLKRLYNEAGHNLPSLGAICGAFFRRIAGIDAAEAGFERITIRPVLDSRVKRGGGDYDSIVGCISSDWEQREDGGFALATVIPANSTARIHLPARPGQRVYEGDRDIAGRRDLRIVGRLDHEVVLDVGSGTYWFLVVA